MADQYTEEQTIEKQQVATNVNDNSTTIKNAAIIGGGLLGATIGAALLVKLIKKGKSKKTKKSSKKYVQEQEAEDDGSYGSYSDDDDDQVQYSNDQYDQEAGISKKKKKKSLKFLVAAALGLTAPKPLPTKGWKKVRHTALYNTIELVEKRLEQFLMASGFVPAGMAIHLQRWVKERRMRKRNELAQGYVPRHFTMKEVIAFGTLVLPIVWEVIKKQREHSAQKQNIQQEEVDEEMAPEEQEEIEEEEEEQIPQQPRGFGTRRFARPALRRPFANRV